MILILVCWSFMICASWRSRALFFSWLIRWFMYIVRISVIGILSLRIFCMIGRIRRLRLLILGLVRKLWRGGLKGRCWLLQGHCIIGLLRCSWVEVMMKKLIYGHLGLRYISCCRMEGRLFSRITYRLQLKILPEGKFNILRKFGINMINLPRI